MLRCQVVQPSGTVRVAACGDDAAIKKAHVILWNPIVNHQAGLEHQGGGMPSAGPALRAGDHATALPLSRALQQLPGVLKAQPPGGTLDQRHPLLAIRRSRGGGRK